MTKLVKSKNLIYFLFPLIFLVYIFLIFEKQNYLFWKLIEEDGWIENAQAGFFLLASLIGFYSLKKIKADSNFFTYIFLIGLNLLMLFCFFEEISWGQRIFDFKTNEYFKKHNFQNETNLHNLTYLKHIQFAGLALLGCWGSVFALICEIFFIKKLAKFRSMIVSKKLFFYFLPCFFFYGFFVYYFEPQMGGGEHNYYSWKWQEYYELLLSIGILLFSLENITRRQRSLNKSA